MRLLIVRDCCACHLLDLSLSLSLSLSAVVRALGTALLTALLTALGRGWGRPSQQVEGVALHLLLRLQLLGGDLSSHLLDLLLKQAPISLEQLEHGGRCCQGSLSEASLGRLDEGVPAGVDGEHIQERSGKKSGSPSKI